MSVLIICEGTNDQKVLKAFCNLQGFNMLFQQGGGLTCGDHPHRFQDKGMASITTTIKNELPTVLVFVLDLDDTPLDERKADVEAMLVTINVAIAYTESAYTFNETAFLVCFDRMMESALWESRRKESTDYWNTEADALLNTYSESLFALPLHHATSEANRLKKRQLFLLQSTPLAYEREAKLENLMSLFDFNAPVWEDLKATLQHAHQQASPV